MNSCGLQVYENFAYSKILRNASANSPAHRTTGAAFHAAKNETYISNVIPAKAGIQLQQLRSRTKAQALDSRLRGNDIRD
jgi:hypothetical protein